MGSLPRTLRATTMKRWLPRIAIVLGTLAACGPPTAVPVETVIDALPSYLGKRLTVRATLRSGARCRQGLDGVWQTYCKDCQYCRGPVVVNGTVNSTKAEDWPMILGGTFDNQPIQCEGPLHRIQCHPFVPGKPYILRGRLEHHTPPRLMVREFWPVETPDE
jgi:hypothetical protein